MNNHLYNWLWKWHVIGGLIALPIVILLAVTGLIYLFKDSYEAQQQQSIKNIVPQAERHTYQTLWEMARKEWDQIPTAMLVPTMPDEAVAFTAGRFSHKSNIFLDPYTAKVTGTIRVNETDMYQVRKLHGELLLGSYGTKVVEFVASWMVVLLITGIWIFWPRGRGWKGLVTIRTKGPRRVMYRDLHAVTGFWFSGLLLLILAGGLPWTDVFGAGYKWVQSATNTGYPAAWNGRTFSSHVEGVPMTLDQMVQVADSLQLTGEVSILLPQSEGSVFSVTNETSELSALSMYHFDQYSGQLLRQQGWEDIGSMMQSRLWVMAFHQGQFGWWNWFLMLLTAIALLFLSVSALLSYLRRKPKGSWGVPSSQDLKPGVLVASVVIILGILLPLFGLSVVLILLFEPLRVRFVKN